MSTLVLVRHGQASFFGEDYDRLSELGQKQAELLGQYWARLEFRADAVYAGPRQRQLRTAELVGEVFEQAGIPWPKPVVWPELDEYDLEGLIVNYAPFLAQRNEQFAQLLNELGQYETERQSLRGFQLMFESLLGHWQAAESHEVQVESWPAFRGRVQSVFDRVRAHSERGRRTVLFTSGGFISCSVQQALGAPDRMALSINARTRNGSLTEFVYTQDRLSLDCFNTTPHLAEPALWTYR